MTEDDFWGFLEACWPPGPVDERSLDPAFEERFGPTLTTASDEALIGFVRHFRALQSRAFTWKLWAAGHLALGGGDDSFSDFRSWLILHGRIVYETVLTDPDALVDLSWRTDEEDFAIAEICSYLPAQVWEERHGTELPGSDEDFVTDPEGEPFPEDDDEWFAANFPRLSAKYS